MLAHSRGFTPRGTSQDCCYQDLHPCSEPLLTHACTGDPPTLACRSDSVFCGVMAPFPWALVYVRFCSQDWGLCFLQSFWSPVIKSCWISKSYSLGIPSPFAGFPGWEAWCGVQNLHNSGWTSLVLLFSSLCVVPLASIGFDFIMIALLLPSCCGFSFDSGCGVCLFVCKFLHPLANGCAVASCDFGALTGHACMSFYSVILNHKSLFR